MQIKDNRCAVLYTTISTKEEAESLAIKAITNKVAACVNIIPGGRSIYFWKDNVHQSDECYMIFKTTSECLAKLEQWLLQNHPYETPAILKWELGTSSGFLSYIANSVQNA